MITESKLNICRRILNCFENDSASPETDYSSIYIYNDGKNRRKQVTLARGFTQDGGNLWRVLSNYINKNGKYAEFFVPYRSKMSDGSLYTDKIFLQTLVKASKEDPLMKNAQDEIFNQVYLSGAINYFQNYKFTTPLSFAVIVDSTLQSGGMLSRLTNGFPEKKPSSGGDERKWITQYVQTRHKWLSGSSSRAIRNSAYRTRFFLNELKKNNWELNCPLVANDSKVC